MKVTNIKNVVIWALVIVNVLFLTIFFWQLAVDYSEKTEALNNLSTLMGRNGIYVNTDNIHVGGDLAVLQTSRDTLVEKKLADTLLGLTEMTEQGGGVNIYEASSGKAEFRNGGEFEITFDAPVYKVTISAETMTKSLLRKMNIETFSVEASGLQGDETVTAVCAWNRQPIFNCRLIFVFKDDHLTQIKGKHAANIVATSNSTDMSSCVTALTHFLNDVKNGYHSVTQIKRVDPGYNLDVRGSRINVVWRVETENGIYCIDAVTGVIESGI